MKRSVFLNDILEIQNGFAFDSALFNKSEDGMPIIRIRDLARGFSETYYKGEFDPRYIVKRNDLLIGMDGEFRCYEWQGENALLNQRVCRLQGFSKEVNPKYIYYLINKYLAEIEENTAFVTVKHISSKQIASIQITLPLLPEQERIVRLLDEAESLRATRLRGNERMEQFVPSLFNEMFGKNQINSIEIQKLIDDGIIVGLQDGNHGGDYPRSSEFVSEGIPLLTAKNVVDNQVFLENAPRLKPERAKKLRIGWVKPNDVLLSHNATVGRVGIMPDFEGEVVLGTSLTYYRLNPEKRFSRICRGADYIWRCFLRFSEKPPPYLGGITATPNEPEKLDPRYFAEVIVDKEI